MGYKIIPTKTFENSLRKLDHSIAKKLIKKIDELEKNIHNILPLHFVSKQLIGLCKYKVGEWRILLWLDRAKKEIILYHIGHRKEIYRNL